MEQLYAMCAMFVPRSFCAVCENVNVHVLCIQPRRKHADNVDNGLRTTFAFSLAHLAMAFYYVTANMRAVFRVPCPCPCAKTMAHCGEM